MLYEYKQVENTHLGEHTSAAKTLSHSDRRPATHIAQMIGKLSGDNYGNAHHQIW
jgi:hypothetical protein